MVKSINGKNKVDKKCVIQIFGKNTNFFILSALSTFNGIIGFDFLKQIGAKIDFKLGKITYDGGSENLLYFYCPEVNQILTRPVIWDELSKIEDKDLRNLLEQSANVFAEDDVSLPFNTKITATIKTTDNSPVYCRQYGYPLAYENFVKTEISELLAKGIIRPSYSSYNSPVLVVGKKGVDNVGNPKLRLVVDFKKLNDKTVSDRYPIPDIELILANLGRGVYFSTIDLKSGFHQILLEECDREKTAFSIHNGKYEFCRLPFGLKNAPSIFQRAIDDVLRSEIAKCCYVYIDDVIIFSETKQQHLKDIKRVLSLLYSANMRVSLEKSVFLKDSVEYLGYIVSKNGLRTHPDKVKDILDFKIPTTLRSLRSFLGLSGYYRRFVANYSNIAKPLTKHLSGKNGHISAKQSRKTPIHLDPEGVLAFEKLKNILASEDVLLLHPDYRKPFELTTDASSKALGAVLSQGGRPITMISRTLSPTEQNYATNEREMLAIVWALKALNKYLYGTQNINIYTDHQPLIFSISEKNPNAKMKNWRAFIEEFAPKFHYKPGKENYVADALSRQYINALDEQSDYDGGSMSGNAGSETLSASENSGTVTASEGQQENSNTETASEVQEESCDTAHSETSLTNVIQTVKHPVNCFRNQLVLIQGNDNKINWEKPFTNRVRYHITYKNLPDLLSQIKQKINPCVINAINCDLPTLAQIQHHLVMSFPNVKFCHTEKFVIDVVNPEDQSEIVCNEHNRAHRSLIENVIQVMHDYYFPDIRKKLQEIIRNCKICKEGKYQRHPKKIKIGKTSIPNYPGEILHMDIYSTDNKLFLTCIDKFSKFVIVKQIASRSIVDIKPKILEILNIFKNTKSLVCDNEKSLISHTIRALVRNEFGAEIHTTAPLHSTSNGQIERYHSTLSELARCLKLQFGTTDTVELILSATVKYNRTIHSTIKYRPVDVLHSLTEKSKIEIRNRLKDKQKADLQYHNKNRCQRVFQPGEKVFVKINRRLGNKLSKIYIEKVVQEDLGTTLKIDDKLVHKDNIR